MKHTKDQVDKICAALADEGRLIEAGWIGLKLLAVPNNASQTQLDDMRVAFFAGAQHLFASIMSILEPDAEPIDNDLRRMSLLNKELEEFAKQFELCVTKTQGNA